MKKTILLNLVVLSLTAALASAATRLVPGEYATIQEAIDAAVDGDVVIVAPDTYTGPGNRDIDFLGKAITVRSIDPNDPDIVAATIIDCNGTEAEPHRGFVFVNNEDANSLLSGLTITNGFGPKEQDIYTVTSRGGAILCNYSSPTIAHCIIRNNSASSWGGGIYIIDSSPFITDCTFIENSSGEPNIYGGWGGAIFCRRSSPTLTNCTFIGNQAKKAGGALYETGGSKSIVTNCTFSNNSASEGRGGAINIHGRMVLSDCTFNANSSGTVGGALCCDEYSNPMITSCTFTANSAKIGGGIYCDYDSAIINNCLVIGNSAANASYQSRGGGISCEHSSAVIKNCLIANNSAEYGGGVCFYYSNAELGHCTITNNSATASGDGICCFGDSRPEMTPQVHNSIVWGNWGSGGPDVSSSVPLISYSNVEGGYSGTGNINVNPLFVNPVAGDYHLSAGSPCRDSGDPLYSRTSKETDIDGEPRVMGIRVDMGADEFTDEVLAMPIIEISSREFVFSSCEAGTNPDAQILSISNVGLGTLYWQIIKDCSWLQVVPSSGESTGDVNEVTLSVDISELNWDSYTCELMIIPDKAANGPQTVTVNLYIRRELPLEVPSEYGTIQAAIDATVSGDTVVVMQGTYNENINLNGKNIILTSTNPNDPVVVAGTVIQGDGTTSVVTFSGSEDTNCQLTGFTITGGHTNDPQHGGGIQGNGMTAKINNCHIIGNSAYRRGGGLFSCDGQITSCTISGNTVTSPATTEGAGLHSCDGPISNCTISNNSSGSITQSGFGGGLYSCHGPITNCTITGNSAGGNGGGLYKCDGPISNCTIVGNRAQHQRYQSRGGGLYDCDGTISNCAISDNVAGEGGGGLYRCRGIISNCKISGNAAIDWEGGGLRQCFGSIINCAIIGNSAINGGGLSWCESISNCIISGNSAGENGGGLYDCTGPINCTISSNRANGNGGGIYYRGGGATVTNCILWGNTATRGDEIYLDFQNIICEFPPCPNFPSKMTIRYSDVQGGAVGVYIDANSQLNWGPGNIDAAPCFADPCNADYHLQSQAGRWDPNLNDWVTDANTSPCIDAGNPGCLPGSELAPNGNRINMGAYGDTAEASKSPANWRNIADLTNDWAVDFNDLKVFVDYWLETGECIPSDLTRNQSVDFADFALMALHWLEER